MSAMTTASVALLFALSLISARCEQYNLTVQAECFVDIYMRTEFDRLFVERAIARLEPTLDSAAGSSAYAFSVTWDTFAGASSVEVVPSCACGKASEWIVYSDAHIVPIGDTDCSGIKCTTSSVARITAVYNDTDLNVFHDRVKAESMEIHGKRYLVPLANLDGTREYSMIYLNGEGKIEEHARWKDPIAVRALDEALPSTVTSGCGKSFQLDVGVLPDFAWSSECVYRGDLCHFAGNDSDDGQNLQHISISYRVSSRAPLLTPTAYSPSSSPAPQRIRLLDSVGRPLLAILQSTAKSLDILLAVVVGLTASVIYVVHLLHRSRGESAFNADACKRLRSDVDTLEKKLKVAETARQRLADENVQLNIKLGHAERAFSDFSDRQHATKEALEAESKRRDRLHLAREREIAEGTCSSASCFRN